MSKGISIHTALKKLSLNKDQVLAVEAIRNNKIVVLYGQAGTAKTATAVYAAMKMLAHGEVERISISRPLVTTESIGFLPGELSSKVDPFLAPLVSFFNDFGDAGEKTFDGLVASGKVVRRPIAFMRGATIRDEVLIQDESQNTTPDQMLMVLTRLGKNGKIVITGDTTQDDLKKGRTGLDCVLELSKFLPFIQAIEMTENMRDPIIQDIVAHWKGTNGQYREQNRAPSHL